MSENFLEISKYVGEIKVQLYHVSIQNKNKEVIDMKKTIKDDKRFVAFLLDSIQSFDSFDKAYHSEFMQKCSKEKGWSIQKLASESIFEFIRRKYYPSSPSRLLYAYFTDSIERAKTFNDLERENQGDYFVFDADEEKIYYYDMDEFHSAVKLLEQQGLSEQSFERILEIAQTYWMTSNVGNTEILYKGTPVLKNITRFIENGSI